MCAHVTKLNFVACWPRIYMKNACHIASIQLNVTNT